MIYKFTLNYILLSLLINIHSYNTVHGKILEGEKLVNLVNGEPFANFLFANYFRFIKNKYKKIRISKSIDIRWQDC